VIKKNFEYIVIGLILIVFFQGFFSVPKGITPEEEMYRLKIHDLNQEKAELLKKNNDLEIKINSFKNEYNKIDSITNDYSNLQVDSFFTEFFNR
jgi:hypothetical protein